MPAAAAAQDGLPPHPLRRLAYSEERQDLRRNTSITIAEKTQQEVALGWLRQDYLHPRGEDQVVVKLSVQLLGIPPRVRRRLPGAGCRHARRRTTSTHVEKMTSDSTSPRTRTGYLHTHGEDPFRTRIAAQIGTVRCGLAGPGVPPGERRRCFSAAIAPNYSVGLPPGIWRK